MMFSQTLRLLYKIKNPVIVWLLIVFTTVNILDLVTALFIRPAESNPVFLLTNSFLIFGVLKVGLVCGAWWIASKQVYPSHFSYHFFLSTLLLGCLLMSLGFASNVYGILHPSAVAESGALSTGEKLNGYMIFAMLIYMIPLAFSSASFKLYLVSKKWLKVKK